MEDIKRIRQNAIANAEIPTYGYAKKETPYLLKIPETFYPEANSGGESLIHILWI